MNTVEQEIYSQAFNVQTPNIALFIKEARDVFERTTANFYTSTVDLMVRTEEPPFNTPRTLAEGYKELGLWIPSNDPESPFRSILLAWVDDIDSAPNLVQYVYLSPIGHMTMAREPVNYLHLKDKTLEEVLTTFIY